MDTNAQTKRKTGKVLFVLLLLVIVGVVVFAATRRSGIKTPEEAKKLKNPVTSSPATLSAAKKLYTDNCSNCHGDTGKGDGPEAMMYDPAPADIADAQQMAKETDGEIFYQITEGKKPMPSFKKRMTDEQRWELVLLVRSFAASGKSSDNSNDPASGTAPAAAATPAQEKQPAPATNH